jgi:hypothetical protein
MPLVLIGRYAVLLVAPHRLSVDYGGTAIGWVADPRDPYLYLGIAAVIAWLTGVVAVVRRRNWAATFCLLGLALTYGMVGNIVALIGPIFAERIMYLPSAFVLILAGMAAAQVRRAAVIPVLTALVLAGAMMTLWYVRLWNHPMALFQHFIKNQPGSERVYDLLFREYAVRDDWRKAREIAGESIRAAPESDRPYEMCIDADLAMGEVADARAMYDSGMGACHGFERLYLLPYGKKIESYRPADSSPQQAKGPPK